MDQTGHQMPDILRMEDLGVRINQSGQLVDLNSTVLCAPKSTVKQRVPFTEEDDHFLLAWVTRAELQGQKTTGFEIFTDLERINPRHTTQSWQARWSRHLQNQPRPQIPVEPLRNHKRAVTSIDTTTSESDLLKDPQVVGLPRGADDRTCLGILDGQVASAQGQDNSSEVAAEAGHDGMVHGYRFEELPPLRNAIDDSQSPPTHFRNLQQVQVSERSVGPQQRADSEVTLRVAIGVNNKAELKRWLTQHWVVEVYHEYAGALLDMPPMSTDVEDEQCRHSIQKTLVNNAVAALVDERGRYLGPTIDKTAWTLDDHDVRFIARLVQNGRQPGRWWDHLNTHEDLEAACSTAYRVLMWIRYMHRFVRSYQTSSPWQKTAGFFWVSVLANARKVWVQSNGQEIADVLQGLTISDDRASSLLHHAPVNSASVPSSSASSFGLRDHSNESYIDTQDVVGPTLVELNSVSRSQPGESVETSGGGGLGATISQPHMSANDDLALPQLPDYPVKESNSVRGQIRGLEWLSIDLKQHFRMQQDRLLAMWGVRNDHVASCVLVPQDWSNIMPSTLVGSFDLAKCPDDTEKRLSVTLADHTTPWVRAATFFKMGDERLLRGADLDVLLSCGPYIPWQGSHLCHHGHCVVPAHAVYESAITNGNRRECYYVARLLREMGEPIPHECKKHSPPCLLQLTALSNEEAYFIQISVLRQAMSLPPLEQPPVPSMHRYSTLEYRLPLTIPRTSPPELVVISLVEPAEPPPDYTIRSPTFYCCFCSNRRAFKKVVGYWCHIRDKHGLVSRDQRLLEIKRSATVWTEHRAYMQELGNSPGKGDLTGVKLRQIEAENFNWDVVMSWKLYHKRER